MRSRRGWWGTREGVGVQTSEGRPALHAAVGEAARQDEEVVGAPLVRHRPPGPRRGPFRRNTWGTPGSDQDQSAAPFGEQVWKMGRGFIPSVPADALGSIQCVHTCLATARHGSTLGRHTNCASPPPLLCAAPRTPQTASASLRNASGTPSNSCTAAGNSSGSANSVLRGPMGALSRLAPGPGLQGRSTAAWG